MATTVLAPTQIDGGDLRALSPADEPLCADCIAHEGLCHVHAKGVLPPPLRTNWPVYLISETHYDERHEESEEARKHRERKERRRARAAGRLDRALSGEFTRSRASAA